MNNLAINRTIVENNNHRYLNSNFVNFLEKNHTIYVPSKVYHYDLSVSENPLGCSKLVKQVLKKEIENISNYPDVNSYDLKKKIAEKFSLPIETIIFGSGVDGVLDSIIRAVINAGDSMVLPDLVFQHPAYSALFNGGKPIFAKTINFSVDINEIFYCIGKRTKVIFICNPNNPTGKIIAKEKIIDLIENTNSLVIVDEANIEFAGESVINSVQRYENLCVVRTLSKAYGLAGLRIGYAVLNPKLANKIQKLLPTFKLTKLAQLAAVRALDDSIHVDRSVCYIKKEVQFLVNAFKAMGLWSVPTDANCFLLKIFPLFNSSSDFIKFLNSRNAHAIDGKYFLGAGQHYVRIAPKTHLINKSFVQIVKDFQTIYKERPK